MEFNSIMRKKVMPYLSIVVFLYFGACTYLYFTQRSMLYFPTPQVELAGVEKIALDSDGDTLRIWRIGPQDGDTILYFGGNAEDVSEVIPEFSKNFPHHAIYLLNYRGYGGSTGIPSEAALFKDGLAVYDFARSRQSNSSNISVIGRSLGSGVAIYVEINRKLKKMVLTTPYDSIENVAKKQFPMFPISFLLKDKFASNTRVAAIAIPTMVILADADEVVPRANSEALIAAFHSASPTRRIVANSTHNSILTSDTYWQDVSEFLH
jgi:fermentation-respiration switch protein FrsA (DUF1100 family)